MSSDQQIKKVLIIDDEPDVVSYLEMILSDGGYETVTAANGREGLEMVRRGMRACGSIHLNTSLALRSLAVTGAQYAS